MESRTRGRLSGLLVAGLLMVSLPFGIATAKSAGLEQAGVFALLGGTPQIDSKLWTDRQNGLSATLKVRQFRRDGRPILDYEVDMQRLMHMVVIRDDFETFAHLHPSFDATSGTFWQPFTKEPHHRYYVYADTTPKGYEQQVFRFTLESSGAVAGAPPASGNVVSSVATGAYTVTLATATLASSRPQRVNLTILKNGKPADDLGTYLGAAAHCVFVNTHSLAYVHVHPAVRGAGMEMNMNSDAKMEMSGGPAGPLLEMSVPALPAGPYKLWIQFRGGDRVYTAPFTIRVQ